MEDQNPAMDNPETSKDAGDTTVSLKDVSSAFNKEPETQPSNRDKGEGSKDEGTEKEPAWMSQLPSELRGNAQLTKFEKIGDLAQSYAELETRLGNSVVLPGKDSKAEDVQSFYEKLGKPKTSEEYSIENDTLGFKDIAYQNNLTREQAENIYKALEKKGFDISEAQSAQQQKLYDETDKALRNEYGNKYSEKVELFQRGIMNYGGTQLGKTLEKAGILYDMNIVKLFIGLGEQSAEAGVVSKVPGQVEDYKSTADGGTFSFFN